MIRHALVELGFGMVDSKVPVTFTFVHAVLALEKAIVDIELGNNQPVKKVIDNGWMRGKKGKVLQTQQRDIFGI